MSVLLAAKVSLTCKTANLDNIGTASPSFSHNWDVIQNRLKIFVKQYFFTFSTCSSSHGSALQMHVGLSELAIPDIRATQLPANCAPQQQNRMPSRPRPPASSGDREPLAQRGALPHVRPERRSHDDARTAQDRRALQNNSAAGGEALKCPVTPTPRLQGTQLNK